MNSPFHDIESALILNQIPAIGPAKFRALVLHFGSPAAALSAPFEELKSVEGMTPLAAESLARSSGQRPWADQELKLARENQIEILHWDHPAYPSLLKTLPDAPPILYAKGNLARLSSASIAIVGSRRPTPYGEKAAKIFAGGLARLGIATVSGLARGIDTCVHRASLEAQGATIAVLGSGLLEMYPRENQALAESIYKEGAIISEFPLNEPPLATNFPRRNRIISGLALGSVIVEAGEKSGALITARYAADQGREVFAVPGPITSPASSGPNRLIKEGAKPIQTVEDILEEVQSLKKIYAQFIYKEKAPEAAPSGLSTDETAVLDVLCAEPLHIDHLNQRLKFSTGAFSKVLLDLELKGFIKTLPGKWYART